MESDSTVPRETESESHHELSNSGINSGTRCRARKRPRQEYDNDSSSSSEFMEGTYEPYKYTYVSDYFENVPVEHQAEEYILPSHIGTPESLPVYQDPLESFLYDCIRIWESIIFPPVFLVGGPPFLQYLMCLGRNEEFSVMLFIFRTIGNLTSWIFVIIVYLWAILWLKIPSKKTHGPMSETGDNPEYQDNGLLYYIVSVTLYVVAQLIFPSLNQQIFSNMPWVIGTLNVTALMLCFYMFISGIRRYPPITHNERNNSDQKLGWPMPFVFYRGVDQNPRILGFDVKQFTNCRVGLLLWQILNIVYLLASVNNHGIDYGFLAYFIIQTVYLLKFYYWEADYFWTLDMCHDRGGYYICWGCLVGVPAFYVFTPYYLVLHPSETSPLISTIIALLGVVFILMIYRVDYEKRLFQKNKYNSSFKLWGKNVEYIEATYRDSDGLLCDTRLLVSGCWGQLRHMNYLFELLVAYTAATAVCYIGINAFIYPVFLTYLLVHRCYRDEKRCLDKYGDAYIEYCRRVPYRIIPFVF